MLKNLLLAGAGGFAGCAARYLTSVLMQSCGISGNFPVATLTVNAIGSLLIGILYAILPSGGWHVLLVTGFCGGFTTFSAFSFEALRMLRGGEILAASSYIIGSVVVCIVFVWLGMIAGNAVARNFSGS